MISKASLISFRNLDLAWSRITTAKNLQHKRMFRHLYSAYEPGRKANLQLLHEKLKGGWKPTSPIRMYLPKASGLLGPLTLLALDDQIILQAIANPVAKQMFKRRRAVENRLVFSSCQNAKPDSIFFCRTGDGRITISSCGSQGIWPAAITGSHTSIWLPSTKRFPTEPWFCSALDSIWITRERGFRKNISYASQRPLFWLIEKRWNLCNVTSYHEKPLARLSKPSEFAAIMRGLGDGIAVVIHHCGDLVDQPPPTNRDAWDVLEQDQLWQVVLVCLKSKEQTASHETIERLVLQGLAHLLREQRAEAFAWRTEEDDMGRLVVECSANILDSRLAPVRGRLAAVKRLVLLVVEQVEHHAIDAGETLEVPDCSSIVVDAANAAEPGLHVPYAGVALVEALCSPAEAGKEVSVSHFAVLDEM